MATATTERDPRTGIMAGVMLALFLTALNQTMISTSMPRIVASLGGMELYSWVFSSYMLASTVTVPIYGKLSDLFGRRMVLLTGLALFVAGSLLAGFAQTMPQLIAVRAVQGLGAGAVMPIAFAVVGDLYAPAERGKMQGVIGAVFGVSSLLGPLIGGFLTDHLGWHWTFLANVPVGVVAIAAVAKLLPATQRAHGPVRIDVLGAALLVATLTPFLLWASMGGHQFPWLSAWSVGLVGMSAAFGWAFLRQERRAADPIVRLALFRNDVFTVAVTVGALAGAVMFGATMFIPLFGQGVLGLSAAASGAVTTPMTLAMVAASAVSGNVASRTGRYRWLCLAGVATLGLGVFALMHVGPGSGAWTLAGAVMIVGGGLGITTPLINLAVQNAVAPSELGAVTSLAQFFRSVGGTLGVAFFGAVMATQSQAAVLARFPHLAAGQVPNPQILLAPGAAERLPADLHAALQAALGASIQGVFGWATGLAAVAFAAALFLREIPLPKHHKGAMQEAGEELATENVFIAGMLRDEDQPDLLERGERVRS